MGTGVEWGNALDTTGTKVQGDLAWLPAYPLGTGVRLRNALDTLSCTKGFDVDRRMTRAVGVCLDPANLRRPMAASAPEMHDLNAGELEA